MALSIRNARQCCDVLGAYANPAVCHCTYMVPLANTQKVASTDTQPPKQKGHSPAEESPDHSADANISDRDPKVGASVKETREGRPGKDGKIHIACVERPVS